MLATCQSVGSAWTMRDATRLRVRGPSVRHAVVVGPRRELARGIENKVEIARAAYVLERHDEGHAARRERELRAVAVLRADLHRLPSQCAGRDVELRRGSELRHVERDGAVEPLRVLGTGGRVAIGVDAERPPCPGGHADDVAAVGDRDDDGAPARTDLHGDDVAPREVAGPVANGGAMSQGAGEQDDRYTRPHGISLPKDCWIGLSTRMADLQMHELMTTMPQPTHCTRD